LILRFGYVRFVVVVVIIVIDGRRSGRVAAVILVVVHFDFEAHAVAAVTVGVHVATITGHAFERSATSAAVATVATAAADVAAADVVSCTGDAGRRWNSGYRSRRLHHNRHQQPIVIVVGCCCFRRFPSRHLLDHIITVVALKVYEIKKLL